MAIYLWDQLLTPFAGGGGGWGGESFASKLGLTMIPFYIKGGLTSSGSYESNEELIYAWKKFQAQFTPLFTPVFTENDNKTFAISKWGNNYWRGRILFDIPLKGKLVALHLPMSRGQLTTTNPLSFHVFKISTSGEISTIQNFASMGRILAESSSYYPSQDHVLYLSISQPHTINNWDKIWLEVEFQSNGSNSQITFFYRCFTPNSAWSIKKFNIPYLVLEL